MKEKEVILGAEEQRCRDLQCISHEKVTDSICDPGNKTEVGKWGKDRHIDKKEWPQKINGQDVEKIFEGLVFAG